MADQNTLLTVVLTSLLVGGGVYLVTRQMQQRGPAVQPVPNPFPGPPVFPPAPPTPPGPAPGPSDAVRQAIEQFVAQLQAAGGGSPAQREQIAVVLEAQAVQLAASGGRPEDVQSLRTAAAAIRAGQTPVLPPRQAFAATTFTGQAVIAPELAMRYGTLRDACARYLGGQAGIDLPTLGAADRTTRDLYLVGD